LVQGRFGAVVPNDSIHDKHDVRYVQSESDAWSRADRDRFESAGVEQPAVKRRWMSGAVRLRPLTDKERGTP